MIERFSMHLRGIRAARQGEEGSALLVKWTVLGVIIGLIAGLGAILFKVAIEVVTHLALGEFAAYHIPAPVGEGNHGISAIGRPWLLPLIVAVGAFLGAVIVRWLAPEAEGHGTDAAIEAFHFKAGKVRRRVPPVKLVASALTIGSGGAGGREGPTAQMSAGFGSALADWLHLSPHDRRLALSAGMGAGIGAIFRAPLGGAMMAAEIPYKHDLEVEALIPALIASIVGYSVYGAATGWTPIFGEQTAFGFNDPLQLIAFGLLGLACGLVGILYARTFYAAARIFARLPGPWVLRPTLGGLGVGMLALVLPGVLHTGYGWVQAAIAPDSSTLALWVVLLLPFAKILATSLSIGSGGSGGIFGPGMVIGGLLGAACWRLAQGLPGVPATAAPFVIVGMMALFGSIAHAPLAVMLMVAEMTGNLALLAPAMVAVGVATLVVGDATIYVSQLNTRADSPTHRHRYSFPLLNALTVMDAMAVVARPPTTKSSAAAALAEAERLDVAGLPVIDEGGAIAGVIGRPALADVPEERRPHTRVTDVMQPPDVTVEPNLSLDGALDRLATAQVSWLPVVDAMHRPIGVVSVLRLARTYRRTVSRGLRPASLDLEGGKLVRLRVGAGSPLGAGPLRDLRLPENLTVVAVHRDGELLVPHGDTRIHADDFITVLTTAPDDAAVQAALFGGGTTMVQDLGHPVTHA